MLVSGTRLGVYEIIAPLGAGGMGEVYRARDAKLQRDVAIKILPEFFVQDPERVARFEREAQLLAALNHPHIASIYGLEHTGTAQFLVMELVEGETLADKLHRVAARESPLRLPLEEALNIARQIAHGLQAAHDKGIVHRDLKPANIALTHDGQVKILDFGLAKQEAGAAAGAGMSHSPTLTFAHTQAGVILGTAAYMSPEQAKGRIADKRSDIWAFGCVLFEMLAGRRAFDGEDVTDTIAAVVRGEPNWSALPAGVPAEVQLLLRRALLKDRSRRIGDISTAQFLLAERLMPAAPSAAAGTPTARRAARIAVVIAGAAAAALGGASIATRLAAPAPRPVVRFAMELPKGITGDIVADRDVVISPDGTHIVYRIGKSQAESHLAVRAINELEPRVLANAVNVRVPFVSPDSRWIGFYSQSMLRKAPIDGGPAETICQHPGSPRGATWGSDGTIVFATSDAATGLLAVSAQGG